MITSVAQSTQIRCTGPYQIAPSIWLTPIYASDAPEQHRILNLNDSFFKGLYSDSVVFPFPNGEALRFSTYLEQARVDEGVCHTWAIRTTQGYAPEMWLPWVLDLPEYAGKGIMTAVVKYVIDHLAQQEFGYNRIHGECWSDNIGSARVMDRAGMERVIGLPIFVPKLNSIKDVTHYIIDIPVNAR
ncbi:hypothetical protein FBU30_009843 [Linnemannia zychae]|nr:hypothetical protein FBU30_009843 [Linnemannia zychae]